MQPARRNAKNTMPFIRVKITNSIGKSVLILMDESD